MKTTYPSDLHFPLTVYFDGSCALCRSEVNNIAVRDAGRKLVVVDCSPPDFDDRDLPVTRKEIMNFFHARDAAGTWIRGVDVFIAIYAAGELDWVSRILRHRWIKPYAIRAYPWLIRNRYRIAALGLHRILNFFTHCAQRRQARAALAAMQTASRLCINGACEFHKE
ncbi:MAG: DUF393 domain-containing protein [Betaproteobacteria bacterium]|nr:DUF393 domain-containing protein [Betaproteobacteria bacterium]